MPALSALDSLFFPVKHRPLQTSIDDELVKVPRYRVVTCPAGVLGVKPAWMPEARPQPSALGRHLIFSHGQADALSRELYTATYGIEPAPQYWVGAPPVGETSPLGAWAAVVYGHGGYSVADVLRNPELRPSTVRRLPTAAWERALWDGEDGFSEELRHFEPALAFTNGFDYDDELTFYVLVTLPATLPPVDFWWEDIELLGRPRRPVLVLKTGRFRASQVAELHQATGDQLLAGGRAALPALAEGFQRELRRFAEHYYHLRRAMVAPGVLVPVLLDLYDTNRNVSSIALDATLRNRVKRRVRAAQQFFATQGSDLGALVRYLMHEDAFDPAHFTRQAAEEVLSQRDAYRNLCRRLSILLVNDQKALDRHLLSQKQDYEDIERVLRT
ncbi:hypothetical protein GCM10028821_40580 [Hymenobacter jeollabukensis]